MEINGPLFRLAIKTTACFFAKESPVWAAKAAQPNVLAPHRHLWNYHNTMLGSHCWTIQNVGTHRFANGDFISRCRETTPGVKTNTPAWCYYNNDPNQSGYGRYYNYAAAIDARGLCPSGWHVATDADWKTWK